MIVAPKCSCQTRVCPSHLCARSYKEIEMAGSYFFNKKKKVDHTFAKNEEALL